MPSAPPPLQFETQDQGVGGELAEQSEAFQAVARGGHFETEVREISPEDPQEKRVGVGGEESQFHEFVPEDEFGCQWR